MKKTLLIALMSCVLLFCLLQASCRKPIESEKRVMTYTLGSKYSNCDGAISVSDLSLDEGVNWQETGLFFYDGKSNWIKSDSDACPFDESKPTLIFFHGMGGNVYMNHKAEWYERGYNVASFLWGTFSDDELLSIQKGIWERIERYCSDSGKIVKTDKFNCTVTELFAAYYNDFFAKHDSYSNTIRLFGHSYGGQLTYAVFTYFSYALEEGKMNPSLFPERYTLLDPFFTNAGGRFDCSWLKTKRSKGSAGMGAVSVQKAKELRVSVETVRTSPYVKAATVMSGDDDVYEKEFRQGLLYFEITDSQNIVMSMDDLASGIERCHVIPLMFYGSMESPGVYYENGEAVFGRETSLLWGIGRQGLQYDLSVHSNPYDYENYSCILAKNQDVGKKLTGIAYVDYNANGKYDDGYASRLDGMKVELFEMGTDIKVGETLTDRGYFEFDVSDGEYYMIAGSEISLGEMKSKAEVKGIRSEAYLCFENN